MGVRCVPLCVCAGVSVVFVCLHLACVMWVHVYVNVCMDVFVGFFSRVNEALLWGADSNSAGYTCCESPCKL